MEKPVEPSSEDCCNSGCSPCIFDVYQKQMKLYKNFLETNDDSFREIQNGISQLYYTSFIVTDVLCMSENLKQLKFKKSVMDKKNNKVSWEPGAHFLVKYSSKHLRCTRAYTPIKLKIDSNKDYDFAIVVKKYVNGVVSSYLFNLIIGEETVWRGPYSSYVMTKSFKRIVMLAQGTGIAPLISIIDSILDDEENYTLVNLFYCCHTVECILFRNELYSLKSYWNFAYKIFISKYREDELKYEEPIVKQRLKFEDLRCFLKNTNKDQFLLCGSAQFMNEYKMTLLSSNILAENIVLF